jgi:hypothetical protein
MRKKVEGIHGVGLSNTKVVEQLKDHKGRKDSPERKVVK